MDHAMVLREFEMALEMLNNPTTPSAQKKAIEEKLQEYKADPIQYLESTYFILSQTKNSFVLWFITSIMEEITKIKTWRLLSPAQQEYFRAFLLEHLLAYQSNMPSFIFLKLVRVYLAIFQYHAHPVQLHDFERDDIAAEKHLMFEIQTLMNQQQPNATNLALHLLTACAEEYGNSQNDFNMLSQHKKRLKQYIFLQLSDIVGLLTNVLQRTNQFFADQSSNQSIDGRLIQMQDNLASLAIQSILHFVAWTPLGEHLNRQLVSLLFFSLTHRTSPNQHYHTLNSSILAIECLSEMLAKKCIPTEFEYFVMELTNSLMTVLQSLTNQDSSIRLMDAMGDEYLDKITEFLRLFLENHLSRLEHRPDFNIGAFLELLLLYTYAQPTSNGFLNCAEFWEIFTDYVVELQREESFDPRRREAISTYEKGLGNLMIHLLDRCRFSKYMDHLLELDSLKELSSSSSSVSNNLDTDVQALLIEEETASPMVETSELEDFTTVCIELALKISELSSCTETLLQYVKPIVQEMIPQFMEIHKRRAPDIGSEEERNEFHSVHDLTVCCDVFASLTGRLSSNATTATATAAATAATATATASTAEPNESRQAWETFQLFLTLAQYVLQHRLHTRSATFVDFTSCALRSVRAVASCCRGHALLDANAVFDATDAIVRLVLDALDTRVVPSPLPVMQSAMDSMAVLPWVVTSPILLQVPSMQRLLREMHTFTLSLPMPIQGRLFTVLSNALLPGSLGSRAQEWEGRKAAYYEFASPIAVSVNELANTLQHNDGRLLDPQIMHQIRRDATILNHLALAVTSSPQPAKEAFHLVIHSSLPGLLGLLQFYVRSPQQTIAKTIGIAAQITKLFIAVLSAIRKEVARDFIIQTVTTLVELFEKPETAQRLLSCGQQGSALLGYFLAFLRAIMEEPTAALASFIQSILDLCLGSTLKELIFEGASLEISLAGFLDLVQQILEKHYRFFVVSKAQARMQAHALTQGEAPLGSNAANFASEVGKQYFFLIFQAIGSTLQREHISPKICSKIISLLKRLHDTHALFLFPAFMNELRLPMLETFLKIVVNGHMNLLKDDIIDIIYELAKVDWSSFYNEIVPYLIQQSLCINQEEEVTHLRRCLQTPTDLPTFHRNLLDFVNDCKFIFAARTPPTASSTTSG